MTTEFSDYIGEYVNLSVIHFVFHDWQCMQWGLQGQELSRGHGPVFSDCWTL